MLNSLKAKAAAVATTVAGIGLMLVGQVHAAAPTISDLYASADLETASTTVITEVGPYVLAVLGILLVVGIGMALVGKLRRGIVAHFK